MDFSEDDISTGVEAALRRQGVVLPKSVRSVALQPIRDTLRLWPIPTSRRFVQLYVEISVVAVAMRRTNDERELTSAEYLHFLAHLYMFGNSFSHL